MTRVRTRMRAVFAVAQLQSTVAAPVAVVLSVVLSACGSSTASLTTTMRAAARPSAIETAPPAMTAAPSATPSYCRLLSQSAAVTGLGAAIDTLARTPNDPGAQATIGRAAAEFTSLAAGTSDAPQRALLSAATALTTLGRQGLSATPAASTALQNLGSTLEGPCSLPVG